MRHIVAANQVAEIVGEQILRSWRLGPYPVQFRCPVCGVAELIDRGVAVGVSVVVGGEGPTAYLHHAACLGSSVRKLRDREGRFKLQERHVCVLRTEPTPSAVLVSILETQIVRVLGRPDERVSLPVSAALADGFELVSNNPFGASGRAVRGWQLEIDLKNEQLNLLGRGGIPTTTSGALPPGSEEWITSAREEGRCLVVFGTGLRLELEVIEEQLDLLTRLGSLVAGTVSVGFV